ncbi:CRISPR-associated endonuclease Cas3'' [Streptomyces sp. NPDC003717]|uniref:CRISPR-associated endonuclease Cas3'' n=1 Tax=Streptomyces sp. NPDC003717 TaxID=3154276 RepID=UPI0033AD8CDA
MIDARQCGKSEGLAEPYPVIGHLIDTALICGTVWDTLLTAAQRHRIAIALELGMAQARLNVMFWAGLHDLGKIMPQFQDMILKDRPGHRGFLGETGYAHDRSRDSKVARTPHETATQAALPSLLAELGYRTVGRPGKLLAMQVAQVLGGHHGRYPRDGEPDDLTNPVKRLPELGAGDWNDQRRQHLRALHEVLGRPAVPTTGKLALREAVIVAGMVIVSDWIASQEHVIEAQQRAPLCQSSIGSATARRAAHAQNVAEMAPGLIEEADLGRATLRRGSFQEFFPDITTPYPLQTSVEAGLSTANLEIPGILLVTAPTGEGKTETALYAAALMGEASGSTGMFFALPTQATANQMYGRLAAFARRNLLDSASLALLHGGADLYVPYADARPTAASPPTIEPRVLSDPEPGTGRDRQPSVEAGRWLRRRGRGILAPLSVGTIDQALMAVLPLRRNALRHLGLSGKTVIIDEAHAYDAYTHALLLRLLEWLGYLGAPVVLLSATLTGDIAQGMVRAYLSGADPSTSVTDHRLPAPTYPGWIYASATPRQVITPADPLDSDRRRALTMTVLPVRHSYDPGVADGRLAVLLGLLDDAVSGGGCVAVVCTTVAEAQQTFTALRTHYRTRFGADYAGWDDRSVHDHAREDAEAGPRLRLLHARFPARRRGAITNEAETWFGRTDKPGVLRPTGRRGVILVATQVIEQSLDLDFDLVVSDLAPMAQLLQRAGRVWRHDAPAPSRPEWSPGPHLAVLTPVNGKGEMAPPAAWGEVYAKSLLQRTFDLLDGLGGKPVTVPDDVQGLVDGVYSQEFASSAPEKLSDWDLERLGDDMARSALAGMVALPPPHRISSLHTLTTSDADEDLVRTRLGADSVQVLPVFMDESGRWLDEECTKSLPLTGSGPKGRFNATEVRELLAYVAPLAHGAWRAACGRPHEPPATWSKEPRLARLVLLPHTPTGAAGWSGAVVGDWTFTHDHALGLVTDRVEPANSCQRP